MTSLDKTLTRSALPLLVMSVLTACGGTVDVGTHGNGDDSVAGASSGNAIGYGGSGGRSGTGGTTDGSSSGNAGNGDGTTSDVTRELGDFYTVWVGETDKPVTYPERDLMSGPQRVLLLLDPVGAEVTGAVTFGTRSPPEPPTGPEEPYPPRLASWPEVDEALWLTTPYEGFEYALVHSQANGSQLSLAFAPLEIYADACPDDPPAGMIHTFCECPDAAPVSFTLAECQEGMYGTYLMELTLTAGELQGDIRATHRDGNVRAAWVRLERVE